MPKLNVQQNNQNVIQAFKNALAIGNLKGIIASDGNHNFSTSGSNPNLLDNAYFVGGGSQLGDGVFPINQRAQSSYSSYGYSFDRWTFEEWNSTSPIVSLTAGGIRIYSTTASGTTCSLGIRQKVKNAANLAGHTLTFSLYVASLSYPFRIFALSDDLTANYGDVMVNANGITQFTVTLPQNATTLSFYIGHWGSGGGSGPMDVTIRSAKIEEGTVSTLANDAPPDFGEELAKCKRRLRYVPLTRTPAVISGNTAVVTLNGIEMASVPTPALISAGGARDAGGIQSITSATVTGFTYNTPTVQFALAGNLNYVIGYVYDTVIQLSCEL